MRITIVLLICAIFQANAITGYAQMTKISLDKKNATIEDVLSTIEENSEFYFLYNSKLVDVDRKIDIHVKDRPIYAVLDRIFNGADVNYKVEDRQIILSPSKGKMFDIQQDDSKRITGTVIDRNDEPIIGASVIEKGTSNGTATDANGNFRLNMRSGAVVTVSFVGYLQQEIAVGDRTSLRIQLTENSEMLDEVVVIGYGTQKKVNLTGAVSSVAIDEKMASRSVTNLSTGLSGLVPGLLVQQSTGFAGFDGATLRIRGLGSVNNANPLVVVDGMPDVDINRINMNDIESISVLKDAASSAIYGSRAANGVILITTKTGKNEKAKINYSGSYAISEVDCFYDYLPDYSRAMLMQIRAAGQGNSSTTFRMGSVEQWLAMSLVDPVLFPNTNQYEEMFRQGSMQTHNISASGGDNKFNFFVSAGVMNQKGVQIYNDYSRYNFRVNLDYKIHNNISIGSRMDGQWTNTIYPRSAGLETAGLQYAVSGILNVHPETGQYGGAMAYGENGSAGNMVAEYAVYHSNRYQQQYNGNFFGTWEIIKGLTARADYSLRFNNRFTKSYNDPTTQWNFQTGNPSRTMIADNSGVSNEIRQGWKTLLQGQISFDRKIFDGHQLSLLAVAAQEYWFDRMLSGSRNDRLHSSLSEIDATLVSSPAANGWSSSEGLLSYIGRLNYAMFDKYLLEANFRYDGSSKFSEGRRYGFFPSVSLGWRLSEEAFFQSVKESLKISRLKLRASIGALGNNTLNGSDILQDRGEQQQVLSKTDYVVNGALVKGFSNTKMINTNLSWESSTTKNIGIDAGFLNNKLDVTFEVYDKLTTGMIRPSDFSTLLSGYSAPRSNIGELRNRGFDIDITWRSHISDLRYSINFNMGLNYNSLEKWNEYLAKGWIFLNMPYHFAYGYEAYPNLIQSWNEIYNAPYQSASYMAPGDILLRDMNGDGQVNSEDRTASGTKYRDNAFGNYGLTLSLSWKDFDLTTLLMAASGRYDYWLDAYNNVNIPADRYGFQQFHWSDTWMLDNRDASLPRIINGSGGRNRDESTFYLDNASFIRMKNVQFGYNFPKKWMRSIGLNNLRFYISAENLFTLTQWRGVDPDKYRDYDPYPLSKTYSVGLNIGL